MDRTALIVLALLVLPFWGCSASDASREDDPEARAENRELDDERPTAPELFVGTSQDDVCTGPDEDWRRIIIRQPGRLKISVGIDHPEGLDADLYLHDGFGRPIDRIHINGHDGFYRFKSIPVGMGRYFFRIACSKGSSVYTVAAEFSPDTPDRVQPNKLYVFKPRPKPEAVRPKKKPKRRRVRKEKKNSKEKKSTQSQEKKPVPGPKDEVASKPEEKKADANLLEGVPEVVPPSYHPTVPKKPKTITGVIILITPSPTGLTTVTLRNIGSDLHFKPGMVGMLELGDRQTEVTITQCQPQRCFGTVDATAEELENYREVKFIVEE